MNGCFGNQEVYKTYLVYSILDILEKAEKFSIPIIVKEKPPVSFNEWVLIDFDNFEEEEFKVKSCWINCLSTYTYLWRITKPEWINGAYQFVDPGYFRLFFYPEKVEDGNKRRRKLYERMCLRRIMKPEITSEELQFNTIMDVLKFFDNSDRVIDSDFIKRNITNCFSYSVEELIEQYSPEINYLRKKFYPKRGIIYRTRSHHTREITWCILDEMFNNNLSVRENFENINNDGFPISLRSLYDYINDRGIVIKGKIRDDELQNLINPNLSGRENYKLLREKGYKIDIRRINESLKLK